MATNSESAPGSKSSTTSLSGGILLTGSIDANALRYRGGQICQKICPKEAIIAHLGLCHGFKSTYPRVVATDPQGIIKHIWDTKITQKLMKCDKLLFTVEGNLNGVQKNQKSFEVVH